jgi:hypothetical protein
VIKLVEEQVGPADKTLAVGPLGKGALMWSANRPVLVLKDISATFRDALPAVAFCGLLHPMRRWQWHRNIRPLGKRCSSFFCFVRVSTYL